MSVNKGPKTLVTNQSFVDPSADKNTQLALAKFELIYALIGLVLSLVCVMGGVILFLNGVVGTTNWTAKILGAESTVTDAAPGAILFIVGLFFAFITRYKFVHKEAS